MQKKQERLIFKRTSQRSKNLTNIKIKDFYLMEDTTDKIGMTQQIFTKSKTENLGYIRTPTKQEKDSKLKT